MQNYPGLAIIYAYLFCKGSGLPASINIYLSEALPKPSLLNILII